MHVLTRCPHCDMAVRLPEQAVGRSGRCPRCQGAFVATAESVSPVGESAARSGPASGSAGSAVGSAEGSGLGSSLSSSGRSKKAADEPTIGKIGRFELKAALGAGAFGRVYRAYDPVLDRQIALKVPRFPPDEPALVERFFREARAAARLRHPNIVAVHESGRDGDDSYIAAEFVPGVPLSVRLADDPLDFTASARFIRDLANGLAYAHGEGVVHRDIKPANIMIGKGDRPQLMDFGLAKRVDEDAELTSEGSVMGTPAYMSPEQAAGDTKAVGPRSDLYSLGVVLYETLTGRKPFEGPSHSVIAKVVGEEPVAPRRVRAEVPLDLEAVCLKAMEKDPARRYTTAADLAADLDRWLDGEPTQARPVGTFERLTRWVRKRPAVAALTAAVFVASLTGTAISSYYKIQADRRAVEAERSAKKAEESAAVAQNSSKKAEASAAEATRQLARFHVADGTRALEAGDKFGALLSFAQAWKKDITDSLSEENHRVRLGATLADVTPLIGLCLHGKPVEQATFSPDGSSVLTRVEDGVSAYVWDPARSRLTCPPLEHGAKLKHAAWSPDGASIVTVAEGPVVKVWNARTGTQVRAIRHPGQVLWAAFDPKRGRLVTACEDGLVRFWDAATGNEAARAIDVDSPVEYLDFSRDGAKLVTASRDDHARIWPGEGGPALSPNLRHPALTSTEVAFHLKRRPVFSPDGRRLLTAGPKRFFVWDAANGKEVVSPVAHANFTSIAQVLWMLDGTHVAVCPSHSSFMVFRLDGSLAWSTGSPRVVYRAAASPDGRYVVNDMTGGTISLRRLDLGGDRKSVVATSLWAQPLRCADQTTDMAFSPDGQRCLVASIDGAVRIWEVNAGRPASQPYRFDDGWANRIVLASVDGRVRTFHPDGRLELRFRSGGAQGPVELADRDGAVRTVLSPAGPVDAARFSTDGRRLVTVHSDKTVRSWDAGTGRSVGKVFSIHGTSALFPGSFSDDARRLAVREGGHVCVWDVTDGRRLLRPTPMPGNFEPVFTSSKDSKQVTQVALSPDGSLVAATSEVTGALAFWEVDSGKLLHASPQRFRGLSRGLLFGPDGRRLVHHGSAQAAQVWRVPDGAPVGAPVRHASRVNSGILSPPRGERLATFEPQGAIVRVWDAASGDLLFRTRGPDTFWFGKDGGHLLFPEMGSVTQLSLPRFQASAAQVAPLVELLSCQELDDSSRFEPLGLFAFRADPARYRRSWLAWRGLEDDPAAQPAQERADARTAPGPLTTARADGP